MSEWPFKMDCMPGQTLLAEAFKIIPGKRRYIRFGLTGVLEVCEKVEIHQSDGTVKLKKNHEYDSAQFAEAFIVPKDPGLMRVQQIRVIYRRLMRSKSPKTVA